MPGHLRLFPFILLLAFVGCAPSMRQSIRLEEVEVLPPEHVFRKNYAFGHKQAAFVGEPIVSVKDYFVHRTKTRSMRPTTDFVITSKLTQIQGTTETNYPVRGELTYEDKIYTIADISTQYAALIDSSGKPLFDKMLDTSDYFLVPLSAMGKVTYEPRSVRFEQVFEERTDKIAGSLNFELLYGGTDGKSFTGTYREYTSDNLARPAFAQNLVYENTADSIRYRNIRIRIHEVSSEKLVYTVLADHLNEE